MIRRNLYKHEIELKKIQILNDSKDKFAEKIVALKYRGYEVEDISDGRKIVITKPGGKRVKGGLKREDIMVFIYNPSDDTLWQISHPNILDELKEKGKLNPKETIRIIDAFEKVYNGDEPDVVLNNMNLSNPVGELPEALIKAYKWIWGQEDVNYPPPNYQGRAMSFEGIEKLRNELKDSLEG